MRRTAAALTLTLVAACGGTPTATIADVTTTSLNASGSTITTVATTSGQTTLTEAPPTTPAGDPAPDFSLFLGDGSTFVLSAEQKPLFMVFWAEW